MPISARALTLYRQDFSRSWQIVNGEFEEAREALEAVYSGDIPPAEREFEVISRRYQRLRSWLYGLLPEIEEREG